MLEFSSQELLKLAQYVDELFKFMQKRHHYAHGPKEAWQAPELTLPEIFAKHAAHFDNDDLDILYFSLASQLHPHMAALLDELTGFSYATPMAWLKLKDHTLGKNYWNTQYRFDLSRPLFRIGFLTLASSTAADHAYLLRPLIVANDVIQAFEGQRSMDEALLDFARLHEAVFPLPVPACNEDSAEKLRAVLYHYHEYYERQEPMILALSSDAQYPLLSATVAICRQIELNVIAVDAELVAQQRKHKVSASIQRAMRSAALFNEVIVFYNVGDSFKQKSAFSNAVNFAIERYPCLCIILYHELEEVSPSLADTITLFFKLDAPAQGIEEYEERVKFWDDNIRRYALNPLEPENCARSLDLRPNEIAKLVCATRWLSPDESQFSQRDLELARGQQLEAMKALSQQDAKG
ncbi:MAG: hypothetical protein WC966_03890 [Bradymonadales bacterium]|jgi:hypothetical protein